MTSASASRRTDRASIFVHASPLEVYAALTDADAVVRWLPPSGSTADLQKFEPFTGGHFQMTLHFTGETAGRGKTTETSDQINARFTALDPGRLVRWAVQFASDDPRYAGMMTMSWNLTACDGGTEAQILAEDVPPGIDQHDHMKGLQSSLQQLARYIEHLAYSRD